MVIFHQIHHELPTLIRNRQRPSSSARDSFRGFCEGLLQDEKITLAVPEVVEASINFDNEDSSSLDPDEERENSVEYISIADVKVSCEKTRFIKSALFSVKIFMKFWVYSLFK
jgi:hypothetical protein